MRAYPSSGENRRRSTVVEGGGVGRRTGVSKRKRKRPKRDRLSFGQVFGRDRREKYKREGERKRESERKHNGGSEKGESSSNERDGTMEPS